MFKIGDKLICKKEYDTNIGNIKHHLIFFKNLEYEVLDIPFYNFYIIGYKSNKLDSIGTTYYYYFKYSEIYEYFYTNKELRKKKLEKLKFIE